MANIMLMPKLGLTMVDGKIGKWFKKEGDQVKLDEPLMQVETDKIVNKVNATFEGILLKIIIPQGEKQVVKGPLCIIGNIGEDISDLLGINSSKEVEVESVQVEINDLKKDISKTDVVLASPLAKKTAKDKNIDLNQITGSGPNGRIVEKDVINFKSGVKSTPTAKKVAMELGVDINKIVKSTRVMKQDVYDFSVKGSKLMGYTPVEERVEMSTMRQVISERMTSSWKISPAVTYELKVDTTNLKAFKTQVSLEHKVTYTDLIVKSVSKILLEFPLLNCTIDGNYIIKRNYVNIGVAVALEEGLVVPVVKYANTLGLRSLSNEIKSLVSKAKNNELAGDDLEDGTFTVTNIGMYEMDAFSPVINQPEVAILGITAIKDTVVAKEGQIVILPMMNMCLTADHRAVDGAVAAEFMTRLKNIIENPAQLAL
ncbi:MAG: 2-oxo acid dehydrogenase subunit E2 [Clostridiales bacterium]|nr:2-oxo acid dehydrogenase subunit E2 [Clostridiales bacterium]